MINYVEDDNPEVRKAAALSSCQLFIKDPIVYQTSNHAIQVVSQVLEKLLTVGITDPGIPSLISPLTQIPISVFSFFQHWTKNSIDI